MESNVKKNYHCYSISGAFDMLYHKHDAFEINYVEMGTVKYQFAAQEINLKKGMLCVLNASYSHRLQIENAGAHVISIEVDNSLLSAIYPFPILENSSEFTVIKSEAYVGDIIKSIAEAYYCNEVDSYIVSGIIFIFELVKKCRKHNYTIAAKLYVLSHYQSDIAIQDIANHLHISKVHLHRVFKQEAGITLGDYILKLRIDNAAYLLKNTNIPIRDMDLKIGLNSRQSFYKNFKKLYGYSPSQYRKVSRKEEI